jgi:hypothetical protein
MTDKITVLIVHPSTGMHMCMKANVHAFMHAQTHTHTHTHTHTYIFYYFNSTLERNTMVTVTKLNNNKNLHNLSATSVLKYCFNV